MPDDFPKPGDRTEIYKARILTPEDIEVLRADPASAVSRVDGLVEFPNYEAWRKNGGAANNFYLRFSDGLFGAYKEPEWMQRFIALHPEEYDELAGLAKKIENMEDITAEDDERFLAAYRELCTLVDVSDVYVELEDGTNMIKDQYLLCR